MRVYVSGRGLQGHEWSGTRVMEGAGQDFIPRRLTVVRPGTAGTAGQVAGGKSSGNHYREPASLFGFFRLGSVIKEVLHAMQGL